MFRFLSLSFLESSLPKGCFNKNQVFGNDEEIQSLDGNSPCTCTSYCRQINYTIAVMRAG